MIYLEIICNLYLKVIIGILIGLMYEYRFLVEPFSIQTINIALGFCFFSLGTILFDFFIDPSEKLLLKFNTTMILVLIIFGITTYFIYEFFYNNLYHNYQTNKTENYKTTDKDLLQDLKKEKEQIRSRLDNLEHINKKLEFFYIFIAILTICFLIHLGMVLIIMNEKYKLGTVFKWINVYNINGQGALFKEFSILKSIVFIIPVLVLSPISFIIMGFLQLFLFLCHKLLSINIIVNSIVFLGIGSLIVVGFVKYNFVEWFSNKLLTCYRTKKRIEKIEDAII